MIYQKYFLNKDVSSTFSATGTYTNNTNGKTITFTGNGGSGKSGIIVIVLP